MNESIFSRVQAISADIFRVPQSSITTESSPSQIDSWDSIQNVNLVMSLEEEFSIQFDAEDLENMQTIGDITDMLSRKLGC